MSDPEGKVGPSRPLPATAGLCSLFLACLATVSMAALVFFTDPGTQQEELFVILLLVMSGGLGSAALLAFTPRTGSGLTDTLRGLRRGTLFGMAWAGAAILQLNAALTPPNLGFLLLVLLIVETIFLARRQNPV